MSDSNVQLHHEVNIDNDHENLESDEEKLPPSISKKKQKREEKLLEHSFHINRVIPRSRLGRVFFF